MSTDISRVRFDPLRDFSGVVLQQGRLLLDADFNELVALVDRRLRAETSDLTSFGPDPDHAGVAWVPRQTPDAFEVTVSGGDVSIGRGRMYVDGLLAENHGIEPEGFDPLLGERTGSADTPYDEQPYWPTPDPPPTGGTHLAYLDVWRRELDHLQAPDLVEVAVGVDATARWQTAWQVRLLPVAAGTTCETNDDEIEGWLDLIRPSDGRLTNGTIDVEDTDDPCELPPGSGFRGLENHTYRVVIHEGGEPGVATFKWSRENASVAAAIVEMVSPTVLRLASVGKDDVLRISTGDWVEIIDNHVELDGELGDIRKVTVDDAERTITFTPALSSELQPADADDAAHRHLRVRRWDQSGVVRDRDGNQLVDLDAPNASGLIEVPASESTQVVLEHGVVVSFSVAEPGGRFRRGDHWVFAARTADASIDPLDAAPPLGVHHHYARLGVLTFPDTETSCRRLWPPLGDGGGEGCDCTVCVTPESHSSGALTVQAAVDQVKAEGGTVCLAAGVYDIGAGIEADGARSLRIRGQGPATVLVARGRALSVAQAIAVTVENLAIVSGPGTAAAVQVHGVALLDLHDLVVLSYGSDELGGSAVELAGVGLLVALRRNVLVARTGVDAGGADEGIGMFAAGLRIEDNVVIASDHGIDLGGTSAYLHACRVSGNDVLATPEVAIEATGAVAPGGSLELTGNKIATPGAGIVVGADALVDANTINGLGAEAGTDGVVVEQGAISVKPGHVRITGNRVHDRAGTGIALRTAVRTFMVKHNVLTSVGFGIAIEEKGQAERVAIEDNEVLDVATGEAATGFGLGILVAQATSTAVVGNTVSGVGPGLAEGAELAGIAVVASGDVRISGNVVDRVGPQEDFVGRVAGITAMSPFERVSVSDNSSRYSPERPGPSRGSWWALLIQSPGRIPTRFGALGTVVPIDEEAAVVIAHAWAFVAPRRGDHVGWRRTRSRAAPPGRVRGDAVAESNQCLYQPLDDPSAVVVAASSVIASANRLRGGESMLVLQSQENRFAAVANLAPGGTHLGGPGNGLPGPWQPLNPVVT